MAERHDPLKSIRKKTDSTREIVKRVSKIEIETKCECPHAGNGHYDIRPAGKRNGVQMFVCKTCGKEVDISPIEEKDLKASLYTIDKAIDAIKMLANLDNPKDLKVYKKFAKVQFRLTQLPDLYYAAKSNNRRDKNKNKNRNNNSGGGFGKPISR